MAQIKIGDEVFQADCITLPHVPLLLLQGGRGMLGCGYFSVETAEKFHDALAVVTGVGSFEEMLTAEVKKVSSVAAALGVEPGMTGRQALLLMK